MWITLLVMAVAVSLEPFRIGLTVVMLNRPRPQWQLASLLCGGFVMGISVGLAVLFVLKLRPSHSAHFTLPNVQVFIGVLALLAAIFLTSTKGRQRTTPAWVSRLLEDRSLWVAGVAGLGMALPSVDYLAALTVIAAAGVPPATQLAALLGFNVVAFALVEIPLLAYVMAPARTREAMTRLHDWVRARHRREVAALLAVVGTVLLTAGMFQILG
ncbi:GAP family protein [Mycobacterium sp. BMJ-28]